MFQFVHVYMPPHNMPMLMFMHMHKCLGGPLTSLHLPHLPTIVLLLMQPLPSRPLIPIFLLLLLLLLLHQMGSSAVPAWLWGTRGCDWPGMQPINRHACSASSAGGLPIRRRYSCRTMHHWIFALKPRAARLRQSVECKDLTRGFSDLLRCGASTRETSTTNNASDIHIAFTSHALLSVSVP